VGGLARSVHDGGRLGRRRPEFEVADDGDHVGRRQVRAGGRRGVCRPVRRPEADVVGEVACRVAVAAAEALGGELDGRTEEPREEGRTGVGEPFLIGLADRDRPDAVSRHRQHFVVVDDGRGGVREAMPSPLRGGVANRVHVRDHVGGHRLLGKSLLVGRGGSDGPGVRGFTQGRHLRLVRGPGGHGGLDGLLLADDRLGRGESDMSVGGEGRGGGDHEAEHGHGHQQESGDERRGKQRAGAQARGGVESPHGNRFSFRGGAFSGGSPSACPAVLSPKLANSSVRFSDSLSFRPFGRFFFSRNPPFEKWRERKLRVREDRKRFVVVLL